MAFNTSTLRPGLLVSLKTTISGNVRYSTREIEAERLTDDGAARARWETERVIADPEEHKAATEARSKARHVVARVCAASAFGMLCPETRTAELEEGYAEARAIADAFNATAKYSRIGVFMIAGRVAADDEKAMRAINSEVSDLIAAMEQGVRNLDAGAIRDAANKAKNIGIMLSPAAQQRVAEAIDAARSAARRMVKAGETAAQDVDTYTLRKLATARTEFLDLSDAQEVAAPAAQGRAVDLEPDAPAWERDVAKFGAALDMDDETPPTMTAAPAAPMLALEF
jgi:hypothetical protein